MGNIGGGCEQLSLNLLSFLCWNVSLMMRAITFSPPQTFTGTYSSSFQSFLFRTDARAPSLSLILLLPLVCWLTVTSCGKGLQEVLVCVCKWNTYIYMCLFVCMSAYVCVLQGVLCGSLQESVSTLWGVWQTLWLHANGTHQAFFFFHALLHTHTPPWAPIHHHRRRRHTIGLYCIQKQVSSFTQPWGLM